MGAKEFWVFIFSLGLLLINWPFLYIFGSSLPAYLFLVWGGFILLLGLSIARIHKKSKPG